MKRDILLTIAWDARHAPWNGGDCSLGLDQTTKGPNMFIRFAAFATAAVLAMPVHAQDSDTDILFDLLMLPEIIDIMREEGLSYGDTIGADLFAAEPSAEWDMTVAAIYDPEVMIGMVRRDFEIALSDADLDPMIAFFGSEQGQAIVGLEVSARRALLDPAVEEASEDAAAIAAADSDPRLDLVAEFVEVNDLIETNVAGSLNSNLAFYEGLVDGRAFGGALTEEQILTDVWAQEADIRESTTDWLFSFLFMAYAPLEDADLEAYIAFSQTEAGEQINSAMFDSFEDLFTGISRSLGRAAAAEMTTQEL